MDLTFTPKQQAFRAELRAWLEANVPRERLASYDTREGFEQHRAWEKKLFEARLSMVEVLDSPSLFFGGMAGSRLPIAVAHGEGYADFSQRGDAKRVLGAMRFVDGHGTPTEAYPANPNGSPAGLTAVTTADGRFTALMPHPERVVRHVQMSYAAGGDVSAASPWLRLFRNARVWLG